MGLTNYEQVWQEHMTAGSKAFQEQRYDDAETHFKTTVVVAELLWPKSLRLVDCLNHLAAVYVAAGKFVEAQPFYERAIAIVSETRGTMAAELIPLLEGYTQVLRHTRRRMEAESLERRLLVIKKRVDSEKRP